MPVEILLATFHFPFLIRSRSVQLFGSIVNSSSFNEPISRSDTTAMLTITAEAAVIFAGKIEISLVYILHIVLSTMICLQGVEAVL